MTVDLTGSGTLLSVVIPVYNREQVVVSAVQSALQGAPTGVQVIVVDDGSTDNTVPVLRMAFEDGIGLIESGQNQGVCAARNRGAAAAQGEWLVFLDSDDQLFPGALDEFLGQAHSGDVGLVRAGVEYRAPGASSGVIRPGAGFTSGRAYPRGCSIPGSFMVRRKLFADVGSYDANLRFSENTELLLRLWQAWSEASWRVALLDRPTVCHYRDARERVSRHGTEPARAARYLLHKHGHILSGDPVARRDLLAIIGTGQLREGFRRRALLSFMRAWWAAPWHWPSMARILMCLLPQGLLRGGGPGGRDT